MGGGRNVGPLSQTAGLEHNTEVIQEPLPLKQKIARDFSHAKKGKWLFFQRIRFKMAIFPLSRGMLQGVENRGSLISLP